MPLEYYVFTLKRQQGLAIMLHPAQKQQGEDEVRWQKIDLPEVEKGTENTNRKIETKAKSKYGLQKARTSTLIGKNGIRNWGRFIQRHWIALNSMWYDL